MAWCECKQFSAPDARIKSKAKVKEYMSAGSTVFWNALNCESVQKCISGDFCDPIDPAIRAGLLGSL